MTTIREIAQRVNVSVATVSKVLTNTPYVAEATRVRVQQAIDELGYKPNLAGRALSRGRTCNIGVIFPHRGADRFFSDPYQITILQEIERSVSENEYNIVLSAPTLPFSDARQFQRLIRSGYLDGAITFEMLPDSPLRPHLDAQGIPCISTNYHPQTCEYDTVYVDDFAGAYALADYIIRAGHTQIAILSVEPSTLSTWHKRMAGYCTALEEAGINVDALPLLQGDFTVESGQMAADQLMEQAAASGSLPTLVICFNDRMGIGLMGRLQARGVRVPHEVSVVGFDDIPFASTTHPPLTTVCQPSNLVATAAVQMLLARLDRVVQSASSPPYIITPQLVVRESVHERR